MAFKISTKSTDIAETSGYVSTSGIYDATIKFASVAVSEKDATSVNFNLTINGSDQTIYGPFVKDKTGKDIDIGMKLINKLGVIAGLTDGDELDIQEEEHAVGKDKKLKEFAVIQQFTALPIKIRLQEEYSINPTKNEIQQRLSIKSFFRADGASAEEVISGQDIGKRLAVELEKYATNVTYKDDLTPELVTAWKQSGRGKSTGSGTPLPKAKAKSAASTVFN